MKKLRLVVLATAFGTLLGGGGCSSARIGAKTEEAMRAIYLRPLNLSNARVHVELEQEGRKTSPHPITVRARRPTPESAGQVVLEVHSLEYDGRILFLSRDGPLLENPAPVGPSERSARIGATVALIQRLNGWTTDGVEKPGSKEGLVEVTFKLPVRANWELSESTAAVFDDRTGLLVFFGSTPMAPPGV